MKIQKLTPENYPQTAALLRNSFAGSSYEVKLVDNLHKNHRPMHEWICIHTGKVIACIAFTHAYRREDFCGYHLAPSAVAPNFQNQGVGSELLRFALRQKVFQGKTLIFLGTPGFYTKFGFTPCTLPICPSTKNNKNFMSLGNQTTGKFSVGYEPEF